MLSGLEKIPFFIVLVENLYLSVYRITQVYLGVDFSPEDRIASYQNQTYNYLSFEI